MQKYIRIYSILRDRSNFMRTVALITEYNPFHFGHLFHLNQAKELTNASHSICIMSSSFVQRGEPAIVDKWSRAKMAIDNGVDLVIELPYLSSVQTAELFAYGSVRILEKLNIVDYIAFGSELGQLDVLKEIANVLVEEPYYYKKKLKANLASGISYPVSRNNAIKQYFFDSYSIEIGEVLNNPNNILAVEYLKALRKLESNIEPITIKRKGHGYNDKNISNGYASASAIRKNIFEKGLYKSYNLVPENTFVVLEQFFKEFKRFNRLENYYTILNYLLLNADKEILKKQFDIKDGLENRIIEKAFNSPHFEEFIGMVASKTHTRSRIRRTFLQLILNTTKEEINEYFSSSPKYIRILGANQKGFELLNKINEISDLIVLNKFADYKKIDNLNNDISIKKEILATNIYYYGLCPTQPNLNKDFQKTPYIVK